MGYRLRSLLLNLGLVVVCLLFGGCQGSNYGVRNITSEEWVDLYRQTVLADSELSLEVQDYLLRTGNAELYETAPGKVIKKLHQTLRETNDRRILSVLIELCYDQGKNCDDPDEAASYFLSSSMYAYGFLFGKRFGELPSPYEMEFLLAVRSYNFATAKVFAYLKNKGLLSSSDFTLRSVAGPVHFSARRSEFPYPLDSFDDFKVCYEYASFGFHNHSRQSGLGVPLIAARRTTGDVRSKEEEVVDVGQYVHPACFLIQYRSLESGIIDATPEYYNPFDRSTVKIGDETVPIELDITSYLGYLLRNPSRIAPLKAMMDPSSMEKSKGLSTLAAYQKGKIPVVFVHGLMSEPRTWVQMVNTLMKEPEIRRKYQFWFFAYPTANPVIYSAAKLREALLEARKKYDPEGKDEAFNHMVLVAHSMGGLLSKMMIQNPGNSLLKDLSGASSLDEFDVSDEQRKFVEEMLFFKRLPFVERVIFICVPHRGSLATRWTIAKLAAQFIGLPVSLHNQLSDLRRKVLIRANLMNNDDPVYVTTGVDNLDPDNQAIIALQKVPFDKHVTFHSIMGNTEQAGVPGGSDGIVPYESSHLDGAESELVVKSGHSAHETAPAIMEVRRILKKHLKAAK